ncbi:MAG TPA: hypothetical protein VLM37_02090 [Fibrobacteraceae bacterium]|nr:hypothetical protein [Fibrobacteraceae bacterium]
MFQFEVTKLFGPGFGKLYLEAIRPSTASGWIRQGNLDLREQEFSDAALCFRKALKLDSSRSEAWRGLTKAISGQYLPVMDLLTKIDAVQDSGAAVFWNLTSSERSSWYGAFLRMDSVFSSWFRLDSLGRSLMTSYDLSDRNLTLLCLGILKIWDTDDDGDIDDDDWDIDALISYTNSVSSGIQPELGEDELLALVTDSSGTLDSSQIEMFNAVLVRTDSILDAMEEQTSTDSTVQAIIDSIEGGDNALSYYQTSDAEDDDHDGCVEEEVADGYDNDGDGLVDEDTRLGWRQESWTVAAGMRALIARSDSIRGDRLINPNTGIGLPGVDSASTLVYADEAGHLGVFRPYWDPTDEHFSDWQWSSARGDSLVQLRDSIGRMEWGYAKVITGCKLAGGCWCHILEEFCSGGVCVAP